MGCVIGLIIGCAYDRVIISDSLNWIKNDEWFVSRLSILRMETAGIETIRVANIFMFVLGFVGSSLPEFFITVFC